jgi:hypothetical protein
VRPALLALALASPVASLAAPPPACPPAVYRVVATYAPLLPDGSGATLTLTDGNVAIGGSCGRTRARIGRTRSFTTIRATWLSCDRLVGKVRLDARIHAGDCRTLIGMVRAPGTRVWRRFSAVRWQGTIAATVVPPDGAVADADTADPNAQGDNDGSAAAQDVAPGTTVGGAAWDGSADAFDDDWYAITLDGTPRTVTLTIADPSRSGLDLHLVDDHARDLVTPAVGDDAVHALDTGDVSGGAWLVVSGWRTTGDVAPETPPWTAYQLTVAGTASGAGDVGPVWVLLLDADTGTLVERARTSAAEGWRVAFAGPLAPGRYRLAAGTDRDGDGVLGDAGEAFGWWPSGDAADVVVLEADAARDLAVPVAERLVAIDAPLAY